MKSSIRTLLKSDLHIIDISNFWPDLRQKQYYNAMCELKNELETLIGIPDIGENLKTKMKRSLTKVTLLVSKLKEKI